MNGRVYYVVECQGCTPILPLPFGSEAEREAWRVAHQNVTSHQVKLRTELAIPLPGGGVITGTLSSGTSEAEWEEARDRATWENQAARSAVAAERERWQSAVVIHAMHVSPGHSCVASILSEIIGQDMAGDGK